MYDGTALALRGDVVVVTFNYRLGVLGFLHLDHIAGNAYPASGNTGLLDQIAALQWVHGNISAFGGDPGNVTIVGSSAGGHAVTTLLATPKATGLFHRAIAQSPGACFNRTSKQAADVANLVLAKLGIATDRIDRLATLPADQLVTAFWDAAQSFTGVPAELVGPVVDGVVLPTMSVDAIPTARRPAYRCCSGTTPPSPNAVSMLISSPWPRRPVGMRRYSGTCSHGEAQRRMARHRRAMAWNSRSRWVTLSARPPGPAPAGIGWWLR
jgi:carboxylesterase type B